MPPDLGCSFFGKTQIQIFEIYNLSIFLENNLKKSIFDKQFSEQKSMTF